MKRIVGISAGASLLLMLGACATTTWSVEATCRHGEGCSGTGKIGGTFKVESVEEPQSMLQAMMSSEAVFDAAQFSLDVSGSTVGLPSNGQVTIYLKNSNVGSIQSSRAWAWTRLGSDLVLSNPDAVNEWVLAESGSADSVEYALHPFATTESPDGNILKLSAQYEGTTYASSSSYWEGRPGTGCREARCHQE